jgi:hypothetical protein
MIISLKTLQEPWLYKKEYNKLGTAKKGDNSKVESYNVRQSKIAIGSGGFSGKGYLKELKRVAILFLHRIPILFFHQ